MESMKLDPQRGQILVQVALMVVVLFAFVALALDVGHVYAGRRRMQNAADAGALAGAREICFGDRAQAEVVALNYTIDRNDAQTASVQILDDYTVTVEARQTLDTFFAGVLGINTANVRGEAAAACGKVTTLCKVWPMAFDTATFTKTKPNCGEHILLWEDGRADCETYSCTCAPELGSAVGMVADARTWIDFSAILANENDPCDQTGCGNSELRDRIVGATKNMSETCLSYIELKSCTPGDSGVKSSSWDAAGDEAGKVKFIPLYDPNRSSPSNPCTMDKDPGNACGTERFFIEDVACVEVVGSCRLCKKDAENLKNCNGPKVIDVRILCEGEDEGWEKCSSSCGTTFGGKPEAGDVKAVNLVPFPYP